ncbi:MAG TPA: phage tail assembly chaperone [Pedomonas sp.]|uniref:phage tail assembly chaperone n=1 Tax=Pedomonas sp. TaxID=2976421 RepID=UPI002F404448
MALFYSPTAAGFFDPAIHGSAIPADARPVSSDDYAALMAGQTEGLEIVADADGAPTLAEPRAPSLEEQLARLRRQRDQRLRESDFTQIPDAPLSPAQRETWRIYRQALRDLPELYFNNPGEAIWPVPPAQL